MKINFKPLKRLITAFKTILATHVATEEKDLVKRLTERSMKTTQNGLGGYRVDAPIDDPENLSEELDKARVLIENQSEGSGRYKIYEESLLILLKSVEVKTKSIDSLIERLEKLK